ncbi:MAG: hypothetical protein ABI960_11405, partial [Candidatus Eisenbacteria bacterium]
PNSAGVVIDAVRCAKLALDRGLKGALIGPSAYFKKSPPVQVPDDKARLMVEEFIQQYGHRKGQGAKAAKASPRPTAKASSNGSHAARNGKAVPAKAGAVKLLARPKKKAAARKGPKAGAR